MSKAMAIILQGYGDARAGCFPGQNPYLPIEPEHAWWLAGWRCWHPANDRRSRPVSVSA